MPALGPMFSAALAVVGIASLQRQDALMALRSAAARRAAQRGLVTPQNVVRLAADHGPARMGALAATSSALLCALRDVATAAGSPKPQLNRGF